MAFFFSKMHGLGNDFVIFDETEQLLPKDSKWLRRLADRHLGIGCDQILIVKQAEPEALFDFYYTIYNEDGSEAEQCGNGARCVGLFLIRKKLAELNTPIKLKTKSSEIEVTVFSNEKIRVNLAIPDFEPKQIGLLRPAFEKIYSIGNINFSAVSMGNPHAIILVDDYVEVDMQGIYGALTKKNKIFSQGVNVGFVRKTSSKSIDIRVFERGVGETQACGSGACAGVVVGRMLGLLEETVQVNLLGGELVIEWEGDGAPVWMMGPAEHIFDGDYG